MLEHLTYIELRAFLQSFQDTVFFQNWLRQNGRISLLQPLDSAPTRSSKLLEMETSDMEAIIKELHKAEEEEEPEEAKKVENLIIQTVSEKCVIIHGRDISKSI